MHGAEEAAQHAAGGGHAHDFMHMLHERWAWFVQLFIPQSLHGYEWIVVSLAVAAIIGWVAYRSTFRLSLYPRGTQNVLEMLYEWLQGFVCGIMGDDGKEFVPFIGTIFIYVFALNVIGLIPGLVSPTADLNCTAALAITVFFSVQAIAIWKTGLKGWLLHLAGEPLWMAPLMFPIHVVGELAKPVSLAARLFGNIYGEDQVIINLAGLGIMIFQSTWLPVPVQFPLLVFGIFTSLVQALVFAMLSTIYITIFVVHEGEHGEHAHHGEPEGHAHGHPHPAARPATGAHH